MEKIVSDLIALAEDKGKRILTDEVIKWYIEGNMDLLIEEIRGEIIWIL